MGNKSGIPKKKRLFDSIQDRHRKLVTIVVKLFPKIMCAILKFHTPLPWLKRKYVKKDICFALTEKEIVLMNEIPNIDGFTVELCYKILRYENLIDEPKCKWGNIPKHTEIEYGDDIQRIINATNEIATLQMEDVTEDYYQTYQQEMEKVILRIDFKFPDEDFLTLYITIISKDEDQCAIIQGLTRIEQIIVIPFIPNMDTESEQRERYSRISIVIIDIFPNILRDIIGTTRSAHAMYQLCLPKLKMFDSHQQTILAELQTSNSFDNLDVSIIYKLLRQFSLIIQPTKGWGNHPDNSDVTIGDDVERIRILRNQLVHRSNTNIDQIMFNEFFTKFIQICHRIDQYFFRKSCYEQQVIDCKKCVMDAKMKDNYVNALKEVENVKLRFESKAVKFYWGDSFEKSIQGLQSIVKSQIIEGRRIIRVQIVFQTESDMENNVDILNSLKNEINQGLQGIEFIVATLGSIVLHVDMSIEVAGSDERLQSTLISLFNKIQRNLDVKSITMDAILIQDEEYIPMITTNTNEKLFKLDFDIDAALFETSDKVEEHLKVISENVFQHLNRSGTKINEAVTILPFSTQNISITKEVFLQAQSAVKNTFSASVTLRKRFNIKSPDIEHACITNCIKIGYKLVFTDYYYRLIVLDIYGTKVNIIPLAYRPAYMTGIDSNTVAVCCFITIMMINITTGSIIRQIDTIGDCKAISCKDDNLYVVTGSSCNLQVMNMKGIVIHTINLRSKFTCSITVHIDRIVCLCNASIYCYSLEGVLKWEFENEKYKSFSRVATDDMGNVYVTDRTTNTVVFVTRDGDHHQEIITERDGLNMPFGIHFSKIENVLLVSNWKDGQVFLFDVKIHKRTLSSTI